MHIFGACPRHEEFVLFRRQSHHVDMIVTGKPSQLGHINPALQNDFSRPGLAGSNFKFLENRPVFNSPRDREPPFPHRKADRKWLRHEVGGRLLPKWIGGFPRVDKGARVVARVFAVCNPYGTNVTRLPGVKAFIEVTIGRKRGRGLTVGWRAPLVIGKRRNANHGGCYPFGRIVKNFHLQCAYSVCGGTRLLLAQKRTRQRYAGGF